MRHPREDVILYHGQHAGLKQSGSKLPHSKACLCETAAFGRPAHTFVV